jgi:hypothetical protein
MLWPPFLLAERRHPRAAHNVRGSTNGIQASRRLEKNLWLEWRHGACGRLPRKGTSKWSDARRVARGKPKVFSCPSDACLGPGLRLRLLRTCHAGV